MKIGQELFVAIDKAGNVLSTMDSIILCEDINMARQEVTSWKRWFGKENKCKIRRCKIILLEECSDEKSKTDGR